uniref:non-specific serine/threonine protein kinase n=1 Tax=Steinernema glaseri TaxID=37863 RepID=A0A1I7ZYF6_9BILA
MHVRSWPNQQERDGRFDNNSDILGIPIRLAFPADRSLNLAFVARVSDVLAMPGKTLSSSAELQRTPEMKLFREAWTTKRDRAATQPKAVPATPCMESIKRRRRIQEKDTKFQVVSQGKSTEEVLTKSSSYRRTSKASYFEQCFINKGIIGRGSFGEVMLVVSKDTGEPYAIKRQLRACEHDRMNALREVRNFGLIPKHPNLLHLVLAWEEEGRVYIQTELCAGNLDEYSLVHDISELEVLFILKDLLQPLAALHRLGLIHFDIKSENVLIGFDGTCKLGDFGLLFDTRKDPLGFYHEGDNRYLDTAVLARGIPPSSASDIFSLGMTVLELATGLNLPKNGDRWVDLRNGILPEDFMDRLSVQLQNTIRRMIHKNPSARPTAAQLLAEPFLDQLDYATRPAFKPLPRSLKITETSTPLLRRSSRIRLRNNDIPLSYQSPVNQRPPTERRAEIPSTPSRRVTRRRNIRCRGPLFDAMDVS